MSTNDNMMSESFIKNSELINKGFVIVDALFKEHNWHVVKNEKDWISYTKFGDETTLFEFKFFTDKIIVSTPIKNSPYQYVTTFYNYYEASEYIEQRFYDYIK